MWPRVFPRRSPQPQRPSGPASSESMSKDGGRPSRRCPDAPVPKDNFPNGFPPSFRRFFNFGEMPDFPSPQSPAPVSGTGSGIVIDGAGNVVTNSHVVDGSAEIKVTFSDGQEIPAKLIGRDKRTDVAVIRLEQPFRRISSRRASVTRRDRGRRMGVRHREPARARADRHGRDRRAERVTSAVWCGCRVIACANTFRPTPRSTPATPGDRSSTWTETSSVSTPSSGREQAGLMGLPSRSTRCGAWRRR